MISNTTENKKFLGFDDDPDEPYPFNFTKKGVQIRDKIKEIIRALVEQGLKSSEIASFLIDSTLEAADEKGRGDMPWAIAEAAEFEPSMYLVNEHLDVVRDEAIRERTDWLDRIYKTIKKAWLKGDGMRHELALAVDGTLFRMAYPMQERLKFLRQIAFETGKGKDHICIPRGSEAKKYDPNFHPYGIPKLKEIIAKIMAGSKIADDEITEELNEVMREAPTATKEVRHR